MSLSVQSVSKPCCNFVKSKLEASNTRSKFSLNSLSDMILCERRVLKLSKKKQSQIICSISDQAYVALDQAFRVIGIDTNEPRISLALALGRQTAQNTEDALQSAIMELSKSLAIGGGNIEEALMSVPDLETIPSYVVYRGNGYEIRNVEEYVVAETVMQSSKPFDFFGASQAFNTLAGYLFGDNKSKVEMEMTTPVISSQSKVEEMEMKTPVMSSRSEDGGSWKMSFVLPSKNVKNGLPDPKTSNVKIRVIPERTVAVVAFSGMVTEDGVKRRESELRTALSKDSTYEIEPSASVEISQYNPPFTPPFLRRNEISLVVSKKSSSRY